MMPLAEYFGLSSATVQRPTKSDGEAAGVDAAIEPLVTASAAIDKVTAWWDTIGMASTNPPSVSKTASLSRSARAVILSLLVAFACCFVLYVALTALGEAFVNDQFPEPLAIKLERWPILFPVHMLSGGLALLLIPLAILLRDRPEVHRVVGRIAAIDIMIAGLTAFPVAWIAPVSAWSGAGFIAQAVVWMSLLALGIWHIRHRRRARPRAYMLLAAATAVGAILFRVFLALWAVLGTPRHFVLFYSIDAWVAWLGPLTAMAWWLRRERRGFAAARQPAIGAR